jgi:aspartate aminotransferase
MATVSSSAPSARIPLSGIRTLMEIALRDPEAIHLEIGEPDARPAEHVVAAAARAARDGRTGYSSSLGLDALREVAADRITRPNGFAADPDRVVVTHGAMHGLAMTMATLLGPGDDILVPDPTFPNWAMAAAAAGARVVTYPTRAEDGFVPRLDELEAAITPRTRAVIVCSPNNPTGAVYPAAVLEGIVEIARRHDLWVLSDECYEAITFGVPHVSTATFDTDGRVLTFFSLSKAHAMTGWRIGYAVVPDRAVVERIGHLAEASVACPSTPSQYGAIAALTGPQDHVHAAVESYWDRRDLAVSLLRERGLTLVEPDGAFYLMVGVGEADTDAFAQRLLARRHVAVAPGSTFGERGAGMVRVSLAAPRDLLVEGLGRLADEVVGSSSGASWSAGSTLGAAAARAR